MQFNKYTHTHTHAHSHTQILHVASPMENTDHGPCKPYSLHPRETVGDPRWRWGRRKQASLAAVGRVILSTSTSGSASTGKGRGRFTWKSPCFTWSGLQSSQTWRQQKGARCSRVCPTLEDIVGAHQADHQGKEDPGGVTRIGGVEEGECYPEEAWSLDLDVVDDVTCGDEGFELGEVSVRPPPPPPPPALFHCCYIHSQISGDVCIIRSHIFVFYCVVYSKTQPMVVDEL